MYLLYTLPHGTPTWDNFRGDETRNNMHPVVGRWEGRWFFGRFAILRIQIHGAQEELAVSKIVWVLFFLMFSECLMKNNWSCLGWGEASEPTRMNFSCDLMFFLQEKHIVKICENIFSCDLMFFLQEKHIVKICENIDAIPPNQPQVSELIKAQRRSWAKSNIFSPSFAPARLQPSCAPSSLPLVRPPFTTPFDPPLARSYPRTPPPSYTSP